MIFILTIKSIFKFSPSRRPRSQRTIGGSLSLDKTDYDTNLKKLQTKLRTTLEYFESKLNVFYLIIILEGDENEDDHAILTQFLNLLKKIQIEPIRLVKHLLNLNDGNLSIQNFYEIITADYLSKGGISNAQYNNLTTLEVGSKTPTLRGLSVTLEDITALFQRTL